MNKLGKICMGLGLGTLAITFVILAAQLNWIAASIVAGVELLMGGVVFGNTED